MNSLLGCFDFPRVSHTFEKKQTLKREMSSYLDYKRCMTMLDPPNNEFFHNKTLRELGPYSRDMRRANIVSGLGIVQLIRSWLRQGKLTIVRVFTGNDRYGRFAFASHFGYASVSPSYGAQAKIHVSKHTEYGTTQVYRDFMIWHETMPRDPQVAVAHILWRWTHRLKTRDGTIRDSARIKAEWRDINLFLADLRGPAWGGEHYGLNSNSPAGEFELANPEAAANFDMNFPLIPFGLEVSHCGESYHTRLDWNSLFITDAIRFSFEQAEVLPTIPGSTSVWFAFGDHALPARRSNFLFQNGNKIELSNAETSEVNESRKTCRQFGLMHLNPDGSKISSLNGPRLDATGNALDNDTPTQCFHSVTGYPCLGMLPETLAPPNLSDISRARRGLGKTIVWRGTPSNGAVLQVVAKGRGKLRHSLPKNPFKKKRKK